MNIAKFLRTPILKNIGERLLLKLRFKVSRRRKTDPFPVDKVNVIAKSYLHFSRYLDAPNVNLSTCQFFNIPIFKCFAEDALLIKYKTSF